MDLNYRKPLVLKVHSLFPEVAISHLKRWLPPVRQLDIRTVTEIPGGCIDTMVFVVYIFPRILLYFASVFVKYTFIDDWISRTVY